MTEQEYDIAKAQLDSQLDALNPDVRVGIFLEHEFASWMQTKGLMGRKLADMLYESWSWEAPAYRDNFVIMLFQNDPQLNGERFAIKPLPT